MKKFDLGNGNPIAVFQSFLSFALDHGRFHILWETDNQVDLNLAAAMRHRAAMIDKPEKDDICQLFRTDRVTIESDPWLGNDGQHYKFIHHLEFEVSDSIYRAYEVSRLGKSNLRLDSVITCIEDTQYFSHYHAVIQCHNADLNVIYMLLQKEA